MSDVVQDLGRDLVLSGLGAIRTLQTHGWDNQAAQTALERLLSLINTHLDAVGGAIHIDIVDQMLLLNGVRLRAHGQVAQQFAQFVELFAERDLGGLAIVQPLSLDALRYWLGVFSQRVEPQTDKAAIRAQLDQVSGWGIHSLDLRTLNTTEAQESLRVSTMAFAMQTYARLVLGFSEFIAALRAQKDPYMNRLNVVRVVQDLIDVVSARPELILQVIDLARERRIPRTYAELHAANACVYAVLIGQMLSLDRTTLLDLGTSALLSDASAALAMEGKDDKRGPLDEAARAKLQEDLMRSVQALLGASGNDDAGLLRTIVAYEQRRPLIDPDNPTDQTLHFLSRIVAVATAYDAMTSDRPWRAAMSHNEALSTLGQESGQKFDPLVVSTLMSLRAVYPSRP